MFLLMIYCPCMKMYSNFIRFKLFISYIVAVFKDSVIPQFWSTKNEKGSTDFFINTLFYTISNWETKIWYNVPSGSFHVSSLFSFWVILKINWIESERWTTQLKISKHSTIEANLLAFIYSQILNMGSYFLFIINSSFIFKF